MKVSKITLAVALACNASSVFAFEDEQNDKNQEDYNVVTVTSNRTAVNISETTNTVSVISAEQMEKEQARNIKDLVRYEPGVSVPGSGRFGLSGFKIRGIGGDRVLTIIDGTPVADEFSFGPNLSAGRNFIDLDSLKAVEIVRGSTSSLYGSNALGGTVSFMTKDPEDYLGIHHDNYYASLKTGYSSLSSSMHNTATFAAGNDTWQGMFSATLRSLNELESYGDIADDPQDGDNRNLYAKLVYKPTDGHQFKFILDQLATVIDTNALSFAGSTIRSRTGRVTRRDSVIANDQQTRDRISLQYQFEGSTVLFDSFMANLYHQESETRQITNEDRVILADSVPAHVNYAYDHLRESFFTQDNLGLKLQFNKQAGSSIEHFISYGIDWDRNDTSSRRFGSHTVNGAPVLASTGLRNFNTRDFPTSEYKSIGVFIQDRISFADGKFILVPAIRYDKFDLTPSTDPVFLTGNPGNPTPTGFNQSEVSSKLGMVYKISDDWSYFAQYSEGFRAPSMDAINAAFTNLRGGYTTLPNPNLKPESSQSYETGLKYYGDNSYFEVAAYSNQYDDFIQGLALKGFNPVTRLLEFQARNLPSVEIHGFEIKGGWDLGSKFKNLEGMQLRYAYAFAKGRDKNSGQAIDTIDPQQLVAGLGYDSTNGNWGTELVMTLSEGRDEGDLNSDNITATQRRNPTFEQFYMPGYASFDLIGYYDFTQKFSLNWGIYNLTDKKHWQISDTIGRDANQVDALNRVSQPGRNFALTLKFEF